MTSIRRGEYMNVKKILIFIFALILTVLVSFGSVSAAQTTVIKKADGGDLYYLDGSGKVMRLTEYTYPTQDFRAAWISYYAGDMNAYINEAQFKGEVESILDTMEEYGLNAMIFHIRVHNDALYDSKLNPRRSDWQNVNFEEFDPLAYFIEESHKRGIEFHAWLNPYRVISTGLTTDLTTFAQNFRNANPQFPNNPAGNPEMLVKAGTGVYLNPGEPVVRQHIFDTIQEVIDDYDVDAIHFDDYFYNSVADSEDNKTYTKPGYNPKGLNKGDWRREQVNLLMKGIDELLDNHFRKTGKVVQLGISPTGVYRNNLAGTIGAQEHYSSLYCDSVAWIQNEWIDYLLPQTYWGLEHNRASFAQLSRFWANVVVGYDVNMYLGHGIYMAPGSGWNNPDEIQNRLLNMEMYDTIGGSCFYKFSFFKSPSSVPAINIGLNLIKNDYWAKKVPGSVVKSYADKVPVRDVTNLYVIDLDETHYLLRWDEVADVRGYMVYRTLKNETLDVNNIDHVYDYIQTNEVVVDNSSNYQYYVATVNQANVISTPKLASTTVNENDPMYLQLQKEYAIKQLNRYVDFYKYSVANQTVIQNLISEGITKISAATSKSGINQELTNAKALIDAVPSIKDEAKSLVEDYIDVEDYREKDRTYIIESLEFIKVKIDEAKSTDEIDMLIDIYKGWIDELISLDARNQYKKEISDYVNLSKYSLVIQGQIRKVIEEAHEAIDEADKLNQINSIIANAKAEINQLTKTNTNANCQFGINLIPYFIGLLGIFYIVIRKRR